MTQPKTSTGPFGQASARVCTLSDIMGNRMHNSKTVHDKIQQHSTCYTDDYSMEGGGQYKEENEPAKYTGERCNIPEPSLLSCTCMCQCVYMRGVYVCVFVCVCVYIRQASICSFQCFQISIFILNSVVCYFQHMCIVRTAHQNRDGAQMMAQMKAWKENAQQELLLPCLVRIPFPTTMYFAGVENRSQIDKDIYI